MLHDRTVSVLASLNCLVVAVSYMGAGLTSKVRKTFNQNRKKKYSLFMNSVISKLQSQLHPGVRMKAMVLNEFFSVAKERLSHRTHSIHLSQNI